MMLGVGERFAGYTVVRQLGGGGMGEVYLVDHPRLPRRDALKILKSEISADDEFRQRFIREADSVASLSHPNIVTVFDRGEVDGKLWIATQYVDGTDAAQLLRDRYPAGMPAAEAAVIVEAIGDALDYAHAKGLLHRDVKPANILLGDPGLDGRRRVFRADFGIARPLGDPSGLTATGFTLGTIAYAAPEQLMGGDIDGRADQYALAASAFHLLTGKPPFEDTNPVAVISKHLTLPPPQLAALRPDLTDLDPALARGMAKDPSQRYPRCGDFAAALVSSAGCSPVLPQAPTQAAVPAPPSPVELSPSAPTVAASVLAAQQAAAATATPPTPPIKAGWTGRKKILAGAAAAVALLAAGLVIVSRGSQPHNNVATAADQGNAHSVPSLPESPSSPPPEQQAAGAPMQLEAYVTDTAGALTSAQETDVLGSVALLRNARGTQFWVVFVDTFNTTGVDWAKQTRTLTGMGDHDAILAVATGTRSYAFLVPSAAANGSADGVNALRTNRIEPALRSNDWAGAAIAAAQGLETIN